MKIKIVLTLLALLILANLAFGQPPHPERYQIIYGNRLGATDTVMPGQIIRPPIWGRTDPEDLVDTIATMFNPLKSADSIIPGRLGGNCYIESNPYCDGDPICRFTDPHHSGGDSTSQGMVWYPGMMMNCGVFWSGDTTQIGSFTMQVTDDTTRIGHRFCPFAEGRDPAYGGLLWGFNDGMTQVVPIATYGCLYIKNMSYISGDANGDWVFNAIDIVYMVNYLKGMGDPPPYYWDCANGRLYATADANGNCAFNAIDITYCVNYLKGIGPAPRRCPNC
jgi:hypothetical protein